MNNKMYYNSYWIDLLDTFDIYMYLTWWRNNEKFSIGFEIFKRIRWDSISVFFISIHNYWPILTFGKQR